MYVEGSGSIYPCLFHWFYCSKGIQSPLHLRKGLLHGLTTWHLVIYHHVFLSSASWLVLPAPFIGEIRGVVGFLGFFCLWVSSLQLVCRSLLVNCHVPAAEIWGVFKKASPFFFLWFTLKAQQSCKCCRKICGNRQRRCPSPASALGHSHRHTRTYTSSFAKVEKMVWTLLTCFSMKSADFYLNNYKYRL